MDKYEQLLKYSNPQTVLENINRYYPGLELYISSRKDKKYMIQHNGTWIHFGQLGYEDFTKHNNMERRERYLKRAMNIKGAWIHDKYSPNWLSVRLLW